MTFADWATPLAFILLLALTVRPLGLYMARVLEGERHLLSRPLGWLEQLVYRACGIRPEQEMGWKTYATSVLAISGMGIVVLYLLQRAQGALPANPAQIAGVEPALALNTASSFVTNTNWQAYSGETGLSYFTQMVGMGVQNFLSAATGIAVLAALIRGLFRKESPTIGNFWVDLTRSTLYILLPLSLVLAVILVSQEVVQSFSVYEADISGQLIPFGPAASQIAIKQLGTNGGGFFGVNSAHPFENPTALSNLLQCLAILLIPASLCITFGQMVRDRRQGWAVLAAMTFLFLLFTVPTIASEQSGNPLFTEMGFSTAQNFEGKEARLGVTNSALWAAATTAASNGSVNSMHDSYTPLGSLGPLLLMQVGEVVFGGVGSGLYGMLIFAIIAVFISGLMVSRTPEYLGKKIEAYEMKMAALVILIPCSVVLIGVAAALLTGEGQKAMNAGGPHGFSQLLYAYTSMGNNNGSAFAGFAANAPFHNLVGAAVMWISRFWLVIPVLAMAGSLARKKLVPHGPGSLPTHTPLFAALLTGVVLTVGALTFLPALALGPIVEHLQMVKP